MLEVVSFVKTNPNWEALLSAEPYSIKVKRDGDYILLMYSQFSSDFTLEIVRQCRGIILDAANGFAPVCVPFFKFANYGESYADDIGWSQAVVWDKLDGSLIKLWHHRGKWNTSTNGTIDAGKARVGDSGKTYLDLFWEAEANSGLDWGKLNPANTYMFELISPDSRIVIPYAQTAIYHIGTRSNLTFVESDEDIGVQKPDKYELRSIEDCLQAAKSLDSRKEGFVVSDAQFRRVKIKTPLYVAMHHIAGGEAITGRKALELIRSGEDREVVAYFGEYEAYFAEMRGRLGALVAKIECEFAEMQARTYATRKEMAADIMKTTCPGCLFAMIDGKVGSVREFLMGMRLDALERLLDIGNE